LAPPRRNPAHLRYRQGLGRLRPAATGPSMRLLPAPARNVRWRPAHAAGPARATSETAGPRCGWHGAFFVQTRHGDHQRTVFAFAWDNDPALCAPFEHRIEAVQAQRRLRPVTGVAPEARGLEDGPDVLNVGDARCFGWRGQLA